MSICLAINPETNAGGNCCLNYYGLLRKNAGKSQKWTGGE